MYNNNYFHKNRSSKKRKAQHNFKKSSQTLVLKILFGVQDSADRKLLMNSNGLSELSRLSSFLSSPSDCLKRPIKFEIRFNSKFKHVNCLSFVGCYRHLKVSIIKSVPCLFKNLCTIVVVKSNFCRKDLKCAKYIVHIIK